MKRISKTEARNRRRRASNAGKTALLLSVVGTDTVLELAGDDGDFRTLSVLRSRLKRQGRFQGHISVSRGGGAVPAIFVEWEA